MDFRNHVQTVVCEAESLESLCRELIAELTDLISQPAATAGWLQARAMLAALPLTSLEYAIFVNRLTSAELYTTRCELGAAKFELTQLTRKLASIAKAHGASMECRADGLPATSASER